MANTGKKRSWARGKGSTSGMKTSASRSSSGSTTGSAAGARSSHHSSKLRKTHTRRHHSFSDDLLDIMDGRKVRIDTGSDLFQQEVQIRTKAKAPMNPKDRIKMQFHSWKHRRLWNSKTTKAELELTGVLPTSTLAPEFSTEDGSLAASAISIAPVSNTSNTANDANTAVNDATTAAFSMAKSSRRQFTVTKMKKPTTVSEKILHKIVNPDDFSYTPNTYIVKYVNWSYKAGFFIVFLSFLALFIFIIFVFGLLLKWAGEAQPHCIVVAGDQFGTNEGTTLADGFALSWTTFSTVGYGAVYTATGNDENFSQHSCALITILCTAESFIGLLYAGICTAIMFGKIGRIQSHAQVTFSDVMCVEYGKEVEPPSQLPLPQSTHSSRHTRVFSIPKTTTGLRKSQFRNHVGMPLDANEAVIDEADEENGEDESSRDTGEGKSNHGLSEEDENTYTDDNSNENDYDDESYDSNNMDGSPMNVRSRRKRILCPVLRFQLVNQLANDPGGEILDAHLNFMARKEKESYPYEPIARFLKVELEEANHPFFNRVWHGRHVLNEDSPLVSMVARQRIRENDGYWPSDLNDPDSVRSHLRFSSVIVTMTGISSISAESVQISKRYYHHDVVIGYQFAPLLYKTNDADKLRVDMTLINDVVEQQWSVGEMLTEKELNRPSLRENQISW